MKRAARGAAWQPRNGYVVFVAALVTTVLLSPLLIFGIWKLATVSSDRALVEPVPGGTLTTGRVVSVEKDCGKYGCSYQPTISFTDLSGRVHEFTAPTGGDDPAAGSAVRVSYDPRRPDDVAHDISISPSSYGYETGAILIGICAVLVLAATIGTVLIRRTMQPERPRRATSP